MSQKKSHTESYSALAELFNNGWFFAVKLDLLCPSAMVTRHPNYKNNGQLVAPADSIIIDEAHVRIITRTQIEPGESIFFYWDPPP